VLAPRDRDFLKRRLHPFSQFQRIIICTEVHEKEARLLVEHMAMDCPHLLLPPARASYPIGLSRTQRKRNELLN
jgi:hypothetical protein